MCARTSLSKLTLSLAILFPAMDPAQTPAPPVQANPAPGCTATPAQLEANRKVVMKFFQTLGADRVALADVTYKQHNPVFVKRAADNHVSDYEEFKNAFLAQAAGPVRGLGLGPTPPGNPFEIVTAECDIVTVIHRNFRHDPTAPGKIYEAFTFDTFRVKDGKLVEHWDDASINPPDPTPRTR
jgi:predicted SnoaL-like aldol condensation-catalyzing enzyme